MSEACPTCGHEKAMGRCWRLTCPENGAPHGLLDLLAADCRAHGIAAMRVTVGKVERINPLDLFDVPDKALAFVSTEEDDDDGED